MLDLCMLLLFTRNLKMFTAAACIFIGVAVVVFSPQDTRDGAFTIDSSAPDMTTSSSDFPTGSTLLPAQTPDTSLVEPASTSSVCQVQHPVPTGSGEYLDVSSMTELRTAVGRARAGDVIRLRAGIYEQDSQLVFESVDASSDAPVVIDTHPGDERKAILKGTGGTSIQIAESSHIQIHNIGITGTAFGIRSTGSNNLVLRNLHIFDTDWKAIELTSTGSQSGVTGSHSHDIEVECNLIHGQGNLDTPDNTSNGEGIYIGSGFIPGARTHNVIVRYNEVYDTTAEAIELKPYTYNITVENNLVHDITISSSGNLGAIVVSGNPGAFESVGIETDTENPNYRIVNNRIWNVKRSAKANNDGGPVDWPWATGVGIRIGSAATVSNNLIWNTADSGIKVQDLYGKADRYNKLSVKNNTVYNASTDPVKPADAVTASLGVLDLDASGNIADSFSSEWVGTTLNVSDAAFVGPLQDSFDSGTGTGSAFKLEADKTFGPQPFTDLFWQ